MFSMRKAASSAYNSYMAPSTFSIWGCSRSALCMLPITSCGVLKKCTQGSMMSKINNFYCFITDILK